MRLALFSDIHGNLHGLQAVLADIGQRQADIVWCGGDLVGYGANPGEVADLIQSQGIPTVMGNYDDGVGYDRITCGCNYTDDAAIERARRSLVWTKAHTTGSQQRFLRSLPHRLQREIAGKQAVLVHASPTALNEYLYEDLPDDLFRRHLAQTGADVLLFGHTHRPYHKIVDGRHLINIGSAGKPKHGNPRATYALVEIGPGAVDVEFVEVNYDYEAAARAIEATDLPTEFAEALRTGRG